MNKMPLLLLCTISLTFAKSYENEYLTLKGLKAVAMAVEVADLPIAERYGLRDYEIANKMEQMLRENGIQVLTAAEQDKDPNCPLLRMVVAPMIDEKYDACAINVNMTLRQPIRLANDPSVVVNSIGTYQISSQSLINSKILLPAVNERVDSYLKQFIDDWLRANGSPPKYKQDEKQKDKSWI